MAVTIAEPNDINTIDPDKDYHVLVYEKSQDGAGIKRLGLAPWKEYLGYNEHKANNLASYTGADVDTGPSSDWDWAATSDNPYPGTTLKNRIDNICTQTGVSCDSSVVTSSLKDRIQTLEGNVGTPSSAAYTGTLFNRMDTAQDDISDLQTAIGSGGGGGSSSGLTSRVSNLETFCGNTTQQFAQGDVYTNVTALKNEVEGYTEGGVPVPGLSQIVRGTSPNYNDGLQTKVSTLEKQMNGDTSVSPNKANLYETVLGQDGTGTDVNCLNVKTNNLNTDMYVETNSTVLMGLKEQLLGPSGSDWSSQLGTNSIAATVISHTNQINNLSTGAYKYKGNVYGVINDTNPPSNTLKLIIDNTPGATNPTIDISDLENGTVFNIFPSSGNNITIQINGTSQTYTKGSNIAWVKDTNEPPQGGHFDELGTAIDVTRIDTLETDVNTLTGDVGNLKNKWGSVTVNAGDPWDATGMSGTFMFTAIMNPDASHLNVLFSFITSINNGIINISNSPGYLDISSNFTSAFQIDTSNKISLKTSVLGGTISWFKLG